MRAQEFINEISDEKLQDYLSRAGSKVDRRMTRMAQARDRLNKGYEIYHADAPNKIIHKFDANTPALAKRYFDRYNANYESDVDYDLRLRRATGIMSESQLPADIENFLNNLAPDDVGVEEIGPYSIHFEGFTDECKSSSDYCENPEAVYQEVFADHIAREGGRKPLVQNMTGSEEYPILYSIFKKSNTVKESVEAYHGTFQPTLDKFNSLSHFGTLQAAEDRLKAKARREKIKTPGRIYQVTLDIKNPFVAKDFAGVHSATHFAFDLKDRKLISQEEMEAITGLAGEPGQVPALIKKLRELGFDSIAYKNKYEDKGSTSYVILDPAQVISVKPVTANTPVSEAFDQPYRLIWEKGEYGSYDAYTQLPDGSSLSINFNLESAGPYGEDEQWQVEFWRNNSLAVTGEGDAYRIFATVLAAIADFVEQEDHPENISFSASKDVEPGQNAQSRSKLYDRMVQRYAATLGYSVTRQDRGDAVNYELAAVAR